MYSIVFSLYVGCTQREALDTHPIVKQGSRLLICWGCSVAGGAEAHELLFFLHQHILAPNLVASARELKLCHILLLLVDFSNNAG